MRLETLFELDAPYIGSCRLHGVRFGEGPLKLAVVAGIHGNETTAIYAANLLIEKLLAMSEPPSCMIIPCVNEEGAALGYKKWPFDDVDIQDAFPGDLTGFAAARIAAAVLKATQAPWCLELQTGSEVLEELPHFRGSANAFLCWLGTGTSPIAQCWQDAGQRAYELRGGMAGSLNLEVAAILADAALAQFFYQGEEKLRQVQVQEVRSTRAGFFIPTCTTGQPVQQGEILGQVQRLVGGEKLEELISPESGIIMGIRRYPAVHAGELLLRIASTSSA
jgi:predicted deacylase